MGQKYQSMAAQQNPSLQIPTDELTPINVADLQFIDDSFALQHPLSFTGATSAESAFRANMSEETPAADDTPATATNIRDLFAALDTDQDGSISLSELEGGMAKLTGADAEREAVGDDVTDHAPVGAPPVGATPDGPDLSDAIAVDSLNLEGFMFDAMAVGDVDISELTATSSDTASKNDITPDAEPGSNTPAAAQNFGEFDPSAFYQSIIAAFSTSASEQIFATSALNRAA